MSFESLITHSWYNLGNIYLKTVENLTEDLFILDSHVKMLASHYAVWFVCLFVCLSSHSRIFHSYGDVTIAGEGLQILTYARHTWPLSSEDSLTCHTYCDTGLPFIMVMSEDPWHSHQLPSVWQWSFNDLGLSRPGIEPRSPACEANDLPLRHRKYLENC